ncbi:LytTR family DNA-binding domain-containing protein [Arcticibacterium luteifluviistationis]|uniref:LytTR family DNA-binding domain-containing protein n=1 Tax=Arcticibacterium luteifluviistationis TaxID=1784714 RepID=UPI0019550FAE|nr:LytTR family DNA-binding domain-containing protein [Arcticibacterium luteifluviistationis]
MPKILDAAKPDMFTHLQASINYTILNKSDGTKLISGYSLKAFEALFEGNSFVRIDRSNLVSKAFIIGCITRKNGEYILLKNKSELLIPRRRRGLLLDKHPNLFTNLKTA